jgi:hypothetical protein
MEGKRFDGWTARLAAAPSRRRLIMGALGSIVGTLAPRGAQGQDGTPVVDLCAEVTCDACQDCQAATGLCVPRNCGAAISATLQPTRATISAALATPAMAGSAPRSARPVRCVMSPSSGASRTALRARFAKRSWESAEPVPSARRASMEPASQSAIRRAVVRVRPTPRSAPLPAPACRANFQAS